MLLASWEPGRQGALLDRGYLSFSVSNTISLGGAPLCLAKRLTCLCAADSASRLVGYHMLGWLVILYRHLGIGWR
jgi:hypothetical protein